MADGGVRIRSAKIAALVNQSSDICMTTELLLTASRFTVERRRVTLDDGREVSREFVIHPGAVVILPILADDATGEQIVMIRQTRHAVGETLLELPAGTLEKGENPADCAARELVEETGYRADSIEPLTTFYTSPGVMSERMSVFVARDLTHVGQNLDETEEIDVCCMTLADVADLLIGGRLRDGKTIAALGTYLLKRRADASP